jgi:hypothetical protein
MKSTTKAVATKKLAKLNVSKNSIAYRVVTDVLNGTNESNKVFGKIIRPVHTSGTGRFTSNMDYTNDITSLLFSIGIETTVSNDSPRGGLKGNFITITTKIK